jgi:hypothetical protein
MNLYYYRGEKPNFGDDLNNWMWPRLMPDLWGPDNDNLFLGIGSIIFDFFPKQTKKIVFGAGYGGYTKLPIVDESWKFYFVRGKHTAQSLNLDPALGIGDAAILIRSCITERPIKRHRVSFMPHWESTLDGAWKEACALASINYIDPTENVDHVIDEILSSDLILTEAMHGAIVSDALRVPWIAVTPIQQRHQMKWNDWASALDLTLSPHSLGPSSIVELALKCAGSNMNIVEKIRRRRTMNEKIFPSFFVNYAAASLIKISKESPTLSRDTMIETAHEKMLEKIDELLLDVKR